MKKSSKLRRLLIMRRWAKIHYKQPYRDLKASMRQDIRRSYKTIDPFTASQREYHGYSE